MIPLRSLVNADKSDDALNWNGNDKNLFCFCFGERRQGNCFRY